MNTTAVGIGVNAHPGGVNVIQTGVTLQQFNHSHSVFAFSDEPEPEPPVNPSPVPEPEPEPDGE